MKKNFTFVEENLRVIFHIVNYMFYTPFSLKIQKEDDLGEEIPEFIEKKVKSAG